MLTYATLYDFKESKEILNAVNPAADSKIVNYLLRATRYIDRTTRRTFFPYYQTHSRPVPHRFSDLNVRRYPTADLYFNDDLLEAIRLQNGDSDLVQGLQNDYWLEPNNKSPYVFARINYPNYWGGRFGGSLVGRVDQPVINIEGLWGYHDRYHMGEAWISTLETLSAPLDATTTTIPVSGVGLDTIDSWAQPRFQQGYLIRLNNELMSIVRLDDALNQIIVLRGVRGSTAASHEAGTSIMRWRVVDDIVEATIQIAKTWRESDISGGSRIGISDYSSGAELKIPSDALGIMRIYMRSMMGEEN